MLALLLVFPLALLFEPRPDWIAQAVMASATTLPLVFSFPLLWAIYAHIALEEVR